MLSRLFFPTLAALVLGALALPAKVVTRSIEYTDGDVVLQGHLAYDDALAGRRPGVLVVHEWWGLTEFPKRQAEKLAELGYTAFALDMYGKGRVTDKADEAKALAGPFYAGPLMRTRAAAGLKVLAGQETVDASRLAAIGYCFGGATVLQLAYSGADLRGVVSFHGSLPEPAAGDAGATRARLLACHGADDPFVPPAQVAAFKAAVTAQKIDWVLIEYGGAVHSFTNPAAKGDLPGAQYHAPSVGRSWEHMKRFLTECFGETR